jgi:hypothetical protein
MAEVCLMLSRQAIVQSGSPATVQSLELRRNSGLRSEKYSPLLLHPSVQSPHSSRLATRGREQLGEMLRYSSPTQGRHRDYLEANKLNRSEEGPFDASRKHTQPLQRRGGSPNGASGTSNVRRNGFDRFSCNSCTAASRLDDGHPKPFGYFSLSPFGKLSSD